MDYRKETARLHVKRIKDLEDEVERLRDMHDAAVAKAIENANEVERLRAALEVIAEYHILEVRNDYQAIARRALKGGGE